VVERDIRFRYITGVVPAMERVAFERMVFRATRGNCYMRFAEIDEPLGTCWLC
jgi:V-type H+-transporting ATPase subunit a